MNDIKLITLTETDLEAIITRSVANGVSQVISEKKERYLTPEQASKILGVSIPALNKRRKRGEISKFKKIGKSFYYSESEIIGNN